NTALSFMEEDNFEHVSFYGNQTNPALLTLVSDDRSVAATYANAFGHTFKNFIERDYEWIDNGDETATIIAYKGTATNLVIPQSLKGLTVTAIGDEAFRENKTI